MHSRKEGCFHRSYAKLIGTKKGSNPTGLVWVTNMASVSFLWDTNMANLKSSECHVILSTSYFLPLVQFLTLGFFFFFNSGFRKAATRRLNSLPQCTTLCYQSSCFCFVFFKHNTSTNHTKLQFLGDVFCQTLAACVLPSVTIPTFSGTQIFQAGRILIASYKSFVSHLSARIFLLTLK